jgi:hypothetical protein
MIADATDARPSYRKAHAVLQARLPPRTRRPSGILPALAIGTGVPIASLRKTQCKLIRFGGQ